MEGHQRKILKNITSSHEAWASPSVMIKEGQYNRGLPFPKGMPGHQVVKVATTHQSTSNL